MDVMKRIREQAPANLDAPDSLWEEVERGYSSSGRHYHTLQHLDEVLQRYTEVAYGPGWSAPREVYLALLAHDIVYDVTRADNEAESATWGARWADALGLDAPRVSQLVLATAHTPRPQASDRDLLHLIDCDLSVLGAAPGRYEAYERGVAAEYEPIYPGPLYRQGRRHFLEGLLAREHIFSSPFFRERLEAQARINLARARDAL